MELGLGMREVILNVINRYSHVMYDRCQSPYLIEWAEDVLLGVDGVKGD